MNELNPKSKLKSSVKQGSTNFFPSFASSKNHSLGKRRRFIIPSPGKERERERERSSSLQIYGGALRRSFD